MNRRRKLLPAVLATVLSGVLLSPVRPAAADGLAQHPQAEPTAPSAVTDLGEPVMQYLALSSGFGVGPNGEPQAYYLFNGNPTTTVEFTAVDLRSKSVVVDVRLPHGTSSSRTLVFSKADGSVYFVTNDADASHLYRYRPGSSAPDYLGTLLPGQRTWSLAVAGDGTLWGGTYPGGRVFSYSPASGEIDDYGQAIAGEQYGSAVLPVGGQVYVGTEPHGRLARLDPATGSFTEIAMPAGAVSTGVDELYLRHDLLFAGNESGVLSVRDLDSNTWVDEVQGFSGRGVSPVDPDGSAVYFRVSSGHLVRYDLDTLTYQSTPFAPNAFPERFAWVDLDDPNLPGLSLALTYYQHGRVYAYNLQTRKGYYYQPEVKGAGDELTALAAGPDHEIYAGAYLSPPGMGRWDPATTSWELLPSSGQVEGYGVFGKWLLYGRYPQGALHHYDVTQPWHYGTNPPAPVTIGHEQNRPQSFANLGDVVAVSSVPETGRHGGAITLWDPKTDEVQVFRDVVQDQTPVSLVYEHGLVYGGTSINGGYGVDPVTSSAKLFVWDPRTHRTVAAIVPVPGAATVSGLTFDEDGMLWGLADSTIFEYNPASGNVVATKRLFPGTDGARYGEAHSLLFVHGRMYGITDNRLFTFDTDTWTARVLDDHATGDLTSVPTGELYYIADTTHVHRLVPTGSP